ncbi:MAG: hypothetical protein NT166_29280 [Candidatus Aminicenantes bacterium]|nr:hypothetical protein [Candidatus Aminicenantes bacterium]
MALAYSYLLLFYPPVKTGVEGLYIVDTSYYYPEDRSLSGSIREAQELAKELGSDE